MSYSRNIRFCSEKEYKEALERGREIKRIKRQMPKYKDLILSAFVDLEKDEIEFDEYVEYIFRERASHGDEHGVVKAIGKALRDGILTKVINPLESGLIKGHRYRIN